MTRIENEYKKPINKIELEEIAPGIRGRTLPQVKSEVTDEQVHKLAEESGSEVFANFIYRLYKVKPPIKKK